MTLEKDDLGQEGKILLRLVGSNNGEAVPRNLWLQKELFQLSKGFPDLEEFLDFQPHLQGPFSEEVEAVEKRLKRLGLIDRNSSGEIELTSKGRNFDDELQEEIPGHIQEAMKEIKDFMNDLSKDELLAYIYYTYPEMTADSVEKKDIDDKREELAQQMYEEDKISLEKASEIAGMSISKYKGLLE